MFIVAAGLSVCLGACGKVAIPVESSSDISSVEIKDEGIAASEVSGIVIDEICNLSGTYEDNVGNVYEYEYIIPKFSLPEGGTTDYIGQANSEMSEIYDNYVKPQLDDMENGSSLTTPRVFYSKAGKENILSVMVTIDTDWDLTEYRCYNFKSNGSKAELKDILALYEKNEDDFYKDVEELVKEDFPSIDSKEWVESYKATMDAMHSETGVYMDADFHLHCVVGINIPAGAGYYQKDYLCL